MAPHISAVGAHVKGQIAKQHHAQVVGQSSDLLPLAIKLPLHQALFHQRCLIVRCPGFECSTLMLGQWLWPGPPCVVVLGMQNAERHVVVEPGLLAAPVPKGLVSF